MPRGTHIRTDLLARRIFKFDTHHEVASLVSRIDADTSLKEAVKGKFYRLSLEHGQTFYCVILHELSLAERHQRAIAKYAEESGGTLVTDERIKQVLSVYALDRYLKMPSGQVRWDSSLPKSN